MSEVDPIVIRSFENISVETITNMNEIRDDGLTFAYGQNFSVKVDFRAKRSTLNEYIRNGVIPKGEIYDPKQGVNTMEITIETPNEIEYSINPLTIEAILENSVISNKDILIETEGSLQKDYAIGEIRKGKTSLYVEGPQSQVEKVFNLVGKVKLENNNKSFSSKVSLVPVDEKNHVVEGVTIRNASIIVDVDVEKVKDVPIKLIFVDQENNVVNNKSFESDTKIVQIQGKEDVVDSIKEVSTIPIKISQFNGVDGVSYNLERIQDLKMSVQKIKINSIESEVSGYTIEIPKSKINLIGKAKTEEIEKMLPETVEVKLTAGKEYSEKINFDDIKIFIDNTVEQKEYKMQYKIKFPIVNIKMTPDVITLLGNN
ncbi:MAG: CdaR family protein [Proteocatella sp.]